MIRQLLPVTLVCAFIAVDCPSAKAIALEIRDGRLLVDGVYVNGHGPYRFLIDTGASFNHIEPKLAASIGLTTTFHRELRTSTGVIPAGGSDGIEVALGDVRADKQIFLFVGLNEVHKLSPGIQGILGQAFLARFDYVLDISGRRLEFGARETDPKGLRALFRLDQGRMMVDTSLGWLVLDSGAHMLTRFGVAPASTEATYQMFTFSGAVQLGTAPSKLVIEGRTFWRGEALALPKSAETVAQGLLPISPFKAIYVCNSEGYVVFR